MNAFWQSKKILVTGATGFVGHWLVRHLVQRSADVTVLIRDWDPRSELIRSGLADSVRVVSGVLEEYGDVERAINDHDIEVVFHHGAQAIVGVANRSPLPTFESNIRGTYNVLEACRVHRDLVQCVVVASSDKAYGPCDTLPYTEETSLVGRHPYDVSKSCVDLLAQTYWHTYELPITIARCGNIYGGGDLHWSRIIPGTVRSLIRNEAPVIRSDGTFTRDYVYVEDVVEAYLLLAESVNTRGIAGEAFNFGPQRPVSVLELVDAIRDVMKRQDLEPVILNQASGEIRDQYLCSEKARRLLGWEPKYSLEEGLRRTVNWYVECLCAE
jgi:CDP-glucose 4,6-dehydratase